MSRLPIPNPNASIVSLTSPFTRRSIRTIKDALSVAYTTKYSISPTETHAAVLVPLCNLNGNPGLLLEVRGKLRAHSGEVRWAFPCFSFADFHSSWSSFPGGKVDPADESVLHAALRETKEEVGIDLDKIEILGRLGPPTRSQSGLRVWPYVVSF
jgi:nudix motif 8